MPITNCPKCASLYEASSEEDANAPSRECDRCFKLRKAEAQRADFSRQLAAEREHRMQLERIVDEVRARNRELEAAKAALVALAREVMDHTSALVDDDVLAKTLVDACDAIRKCSPPPAQLQNATEHVVVLRDFDH